MYERLAISSHAVGKAASEIPQKRRQGKEWLQNMQVCYKDLIVSVSD